jgi:hypothetical protein
MNKRDSENLMGWFFLVMLFLLFWTSLIFKNCIFVWPPFKDFNECVQEQKEPAGRKAAEFPNVE